MKKVKFVVLFMLVLISALALSACAPKVETVTVTFDLQGGTMDSPATVEVVKGDSVKLPTPEKDGFDFVGWLTSADDPTTYFSKKTSVTEDITLYAHWVDDYFSFSFEGGTYSVSAPWFEGKELVFPSVYKGKAVTSIDSSAVNNNENLESVVIPASIVSIGYKAFSNCVNLKSVVFEEGSRLESIGDNVFENCVQLQSMDFPASVKEFGSNIFRNCPGLKRLTVDENNPTFHSAGNCIISTFSKTLVLGCAGSVIPDDDSVVAISQNAFRYCNGLKEIVIPDSVVDIGRLAFIGCQDLEKVTFNEWSLLNGINEMMFQDCINLESVVLPRSVDIIGYSAFENCRRLSEISFGEGSELKVLSTSAFKGCSGLTSFEIPSRVTLIEQGAFFGCDQLVEVVNHSKLDLQIGDNFNNGGVAYRAKQIIDSVSQSKLVKEGDFTFYNDNGNYFLVSCRDKSTEVELPSDINGNSYTINAYAFANCPDLTGVKISSGVNSIDSYAFTNCPQLTHVEILSSVSSISNYAFSDCSQLTSIEISENVESVAIYAFDGCEKLTNLTVDEANPVYSSNGNCLIERSTKTLVIGLSSSVIPSDGSVTTIGELAFAHCKGLKSIVIPACITGIEARAFSGCANLTSITFEKDGLLEYIGSSAFANCTSLVSIEIPSSVTGIGSWAFGGCTKLTNVTFEQNSQLQEISEGMFNSCTNLIRIEVPSSVKKITTNAFKNCSNLTQIVIGENVNLIEEGAFNGCVRLVEVVNLSDLNITVGFAEHGGVALNARQVISSVAESKLIQRGSYIFYNDGGQYYLIACSDVKSNMVLPTDVDGNKYIIADYAFYNYKDIEGVVMLQGIVGIGENAFGNCKKLYSIVICEDVEAIESGAFAGCSGVKIYCKAESKPEGWVEGWNPEDSTVTWGYKG